MRTDTHQKRNLKLKKGNLVNSKRIYAYKKKKREKSIKYKYKE